METLPKMGVSRANMMKRVARFNDLKGSDGGLPDSTAPQCERNSLQRDRFPAAARRRRGRDFAGRRRCVTACRNSDF